MATIAIAPIGSMPVVNHDLEISGTVTVEPNSVVRSIDLALSDGIAMPVFDVSAKFDPPSRWSAQIPLAKLLTPYQGEPKANKVIVTVRLITNAQQCETASGSGSFFAAPPDATLDAALDAGRLQ